MYNGSDSLLMRFEYADARMPVAMTKDGVKYYLAYDQAGTLKAVANAAEGVVKRIEYDTFGNVISDSDPSFAVPFGFAGGLHDSDTGLVRFGYRDYDPETGRWTAKDPILFAGGDTDLYGYCVNDPVNLVDPLGLEEGISYDNNGILTGETGIEANPIIDPTVLVGLIGGSAVKALAQLESAIAVKGPFGSISEKMLEKLMSGPTTKVFTKLTSSPVAGKGLSTTTDRALACAARTEGNIFSAEIPTSLINALERIGLIQKSTTLMGNVVAQEIRFHPSITFLINKFFK